MLLLGVFLCAGLIAFFVIKNTVSNTVEHQAVALAEIAAVQATSARSVYAKEIVEKLRQDGFGSHVESAHMKGYVPIPAQFLKLLGRASTANTSNLFQYKPVSKWNLEASQGINDDFLRWAWPQIEQQDLPHPGGPIDWKPVWRFEQQGEKRVLRYLSPDPASQPSCVGCHNTYENNQDIITRRVTDHVSPGKQWQQHQLMGALSITIPLDKVEAVAAVRVRETTILIFGILSASLGLAIWFSRRQFKREISLHDVERELRLSEIEARDVKELLSAKQDVERAFTELSAYIQAIDQHAIVSVADTQGRISQVNKKFCEISGYNEAELIGQDHRIVNSAYHPKSFFVDLWRTIAHGDIWRGECCNRAKSGEIYWVDSTIVPVKDREGNIVHYISIRIDVTERKLAEQRMTHIANHDALTGLPNRYLLEDRFQTVLAACRRGNVKTAVMFIDLDKFKPINDTLGHKVGDLLLIEVTKRLRGEMREVDTVSRHGGDEFIVLLANIASAADADRLAHKLLHSVIQPYEIAGNTLNISASIGVALYPQDGGGMEELLKHSDLAMYIAKQKGGNNCQFYTPDLHK